jgi:hypothetical protein
VPTYALRVKRAMCRMAIMRTANYEWSQRCVRWLQCQAWMQMIAVTKAVKEWSYGVRGGAWMMGKVQCYLFYSNWEWILVGIWMMVTVSSTREDWNQSGLSNVYMMMAVVFLSAKREDRTKDGWMMALVLLRPRLEPGWAVDMTAVTYFSSEYVQSVWSVSLSNDYSVYTSWDWRQRVMSEYITTVGLFYDGCGVSAVSASQYELSV